MTTKTFHIDIGWANQPLGYLYDRVAGGILKELQGCPDNGYPRQILSGSCVQQNRGAW